MDDKKYQHLPHAEEASIDPWNPVVTIVTPSFNQAKFLPETLNSVARQTYPFIEHLVFDGGSTDSSPEILAQWPRPAAPRSFRWRSERDGGQAAAVNQAVAVASGEIIGWLNSDDILLPDAIARVVTHFRDNRHHIMVYGQARWIDEEGGAGEWYPTLPNGRLDDFPDGCFICQPTVYLRRAAFQALGSLDASLYAAHDFDCWIRFFKAAPHRVGFIPAEQARSRLHAATKTLGAWDRAALEAMQVIHRHFGSVPHHWMETAITECWRKHPREQGLPPAVGKSFLRKALPLLTDEGAEKIKSWLRADRRLAAAGPDVAMEIQPDGWATQRTPIRLRRTFQRFLVIEGWHAHPAGLPISLVIYSASEHLAYLTLGDNGPFLWRVPLPDVADALRLETFDLVAGPTFSPAALGVTPGDERELSVIITKVRLE